MFIFPSPHSQNIQELKAIFKELNPHCQGYHIDIMDGQFVPATMGSIELTNQIAQLTDKPLWVHLMVKNPVDWVSKLKLKPKSIVSAHYKALSSSMDQFIAQAKEQKLEPSLAISPAVTVQEILPLCRQFEHILVMSVEPGKKGQSFLPDTLSKITELVNYRSQQEICLSITVDGGVNSSNIGQLESLSVSCVAVTSAIFNAPDPVKLLENLKQLIK
jgi:ribulose-phosphate 3-epimerase